MSKHEQLCWTRLVLGTNQDPKILFSDFITLTVRENETSKSATSTRSKDLTIQILNPCSFYHIPSLLSPLVLLESVTNHRHPTDSVRQSRKNRRQRPIKEKTSL